MTRHVLGGESDCGQCAGLLLALLLLPAVRLFWRRRLEGPLHVRQAPFSTGTTSIKDRAMSLIDAYSWYGLHWHDLRRHVQPHRHWQRCLAGGSAARIWAPRNDGQVELLKAHGYTLAQYSWTDEAAPIQLSCSNVIRALPEEWQDSFDMILEKGLLDAVYLSDATTDNVQLAIGHLQQTLRVGGLFVSAVLPPDDRRTWWRDEDWEWIRDGQADPEKDVSSFENCGNPAKSHMDSLFTISTYCDRTAIHSLYDLDLL
jgi:hypothetical protein